MSLEDLKLRESVELILPVPFSSLLVHSSSRIEAPLRKDSESKHAFLNIAG